LIDEVIDEFGVAARRADAVPCTSRVPLISWAELVVRKV
jgi:hypothetical protein